MRLNHKTVVQIVPCEQVKGGGSPIFLQIFLFRLRIVLFRVQINSQTGGGSCSHIQGSYSQAAGAAEVSGFTSLRIALIIHVF